MAAEPTHNLDAFLEFVRDARGFDFTGYKRTSIARRVAKRMGEVGVETYDEYVDYLELHGDEFASLFNTILINVTTFFRDPATWESLATDIIPSLVKSRPAGSPIRVWSAGCASGEEAYTLAMILARVLGDRDFLERVKIYATDVDDEALEQARHGAYAPKQLQDVPQEALERFFELTDQRYVFRKDLRRCVIFGRNDLVQDAPISRIDLLVCRNTLMYFTADVQTQILRRFHFALHDEGFLLLGKSEMLITHGDLFTPVDLKRRVFRRVARTAARLHHRTHVPDPTDGASQTITDSLREAAFDTSEVAQAVLDAHGALVMANDSVRRLFGLEVNDLGRPIQDLELSFRPVELRSHLAIVSNELRSIDVKGVRWPLESHERLFDIRLSPLVSDGVLLGITVTYQDVTSVHRLHEELTTSRRDLETASEELQSTVEELETTNEELHSTNEELETSNEELETMNEELHSANEELETMNEELRHRTIELNSTNLFLEKILSTIGLAVAIVDRQQHVQIWNGQAQELWGLSAEEVEDQNLFGLDFGLPVDQIRPQLRAVLTGISDHEEASIAATNRRGLAFSCHVTLLPLGSADGHGPSGVILMMEAVDS